MDDNTNGDVNNDNDNMAASFATITKTGMGHNGPNKDDDM